MAYRHDEEAEAQRLRALSAQVAELETRLAQRSMLVAQRKRVASQLKDASTNRRAKVPLPLLARIRIASPCHERWDRMTGDDRMRHCAACDKDVYDLSEMTAAEAEELLANVGEAACVRLHRRADGTVITSDCPVGAKRKRRNRWLAAGASIAGSAMAATAALLTTSAAEKAPVAPRYDVTQVAGAMELMPEPPTDLVPVPYDVPSGGIQFEPEPPEESLEAPPPSEPEQPARPARRHRSRAR